MKVEDQPLTMLPAGKTEEVWQPENDFRTGYLADFQPPRSAGRSRQETARFPSEPSRRATSHSSCVEPADLASVSTIVRSFSNSVRRTPSPVSANVRQKVALIAR